MTKKFDMTWGESVCVRQALENHLGNYKAPTYDRYDMHKMGYTPHYGNPELIEMTKDVIERQTGHRYEHVILTNGAAGGITIALRMFKQRTFNTVVTNPGPYFPIYPTMFDAVDMKHQLLTPTYKWDVDEEDAVFLLDSPSNPLGLVNHGLSSFPEICHPYVIWDAVYHNNVYAPLARSPVDFANVMIGSYSKLLGLNGIRIGWIATDDPFAYERTKSLVDAEYCGLSGPSQEILLQVLKHIEWDTFEKSARNRLDCNRGEWQKLEKYFDGQEVNPLGMFYYGPMDKSAKNLFEKAGVEWVSGAKCGDSDDYGRFNLAQDTNLVLQAVISVLRADKS